MDDEALIRRHIEPNPHRSSLAEAWLKDSAIPVWALVGSLPAVDYDLDALADDYGLPREAVDAAMAYYRRHKAVLDARVAANTATPSWPFVAVGVPV